MRAEDADDTLFRIVKGTPPIIFFMYPLSEPSIIQPTNHPSQCSTVVRTVVRRDTASQWEMAILGVSEFRNPRTDRLKI